MEKIYFIRHKFKELSPEIESYCKEHSCVAIHFNNEFHPDFSDYSGEAQADKGFKSAFNLILKLGREGGIVVTEYSNTEFYIGEVLPGTRIEGFNYGKKIGSEDDFYKTLSLQNVEGPFCYADYPLVSALRPPFVTICGLNDYSRNIILHLYRNVPLTLDVINLHPMLLEQMCEEWLRSELADNFRIKFSLLQTGKTLPTIDIYARTFKGDDLLVQVTHAREKNKVMDKAARLAEYIESRSSGRQPIGMFLAPAECEKYVTNSRLTFISIESVFNQLAAAPDYKEMLNSMIGIQE